MNSVLPTFSRFVSFSLIFVAIIVPTTRGQNQGKDDFAVVEGTICDSQSVPLNDATLSLESVDQTKKFATHSDSMGKYRFARVPNGKYTLRADKTGYPAKNDGPFLLQKGESKNIELHLDKEKSSSDAKDNSGAVQFSDEPQFQVAGIADPTNYGGHGSDTVLRTKEALAKETVSLNHHGLDDSPTNSPNNVSTTAGGAEMHRYKGDAAESEGRPLEAVREYQLAAELQPSEANLFAWGSELLLHRAYDPAIEVFSTGQKLFPNSARMLLGLGIATYDQGATERGEQLVLKACDLSPSDPDPYLFLGSLQEAEKIEPQGWTEKLQRFVSLHPNNAMAHYYYAVALSKRKTENEDYAAIQAEFEKAVKLNPKFGKTYLQLGILYYEKKNFPAAISAFKKAIETLPLPDEAHYRLAQVYRQTGDTEKAHLEIKLYNETSQLKTKQAEEQRHEIQQFVYTLRGQKTDSAAPDAKPQ